MIWVKYKSGVIWGHRGQKVIFSKNATSATEYVVLSALCNIVYPCYHVTHKSLTWDSQLHSLVPGQLGITSADRVRRLWRQHVSSSFFLSSCWDVSLCFYFIVGFFSSFYPYLMFLSFFLSFLFFSFLFFSMGKGFWWQREWKLNQKTIIKLLFFISI